VAAFFLLVSAVTSQINRKVIGHKVINGRGLRSVENVVIKSKNSEVAGRKISLL
jgi:hypothetical protein